MVSEILNIRSEDIKKLKNKIAEDKLFTNEKVVVTTLELLAAHIWKARCYALNMSPDETMVLGLAIGLRTIMEPPIPQGYYGNAFLNGYVSLTAKELREASLSRVVSLIKDMKRSAMEKRFVSSQLSETEGRVKVMASPDCNCIGTMILSDWRQIGLHYDGWGGLVNLIPLIPVTMPLFWILLPVSKAVLEMSGGVRLLVTLPRDAMAKFKQEMNAK